MLRVGVDVGAAFVGAAAAADVEVIVGAASSTSKGMLDGVRERRRGIGALLGMVISMTLMRHWDAWGVEGWKIGL